MMITYIHETELHKGIEAAMKALNKADIVAGKNQDREDQLKEIHLLMDIDNVQEIKITMAMPTGVETLVDYVLEIVEGTKDFEKDLYGYTYHDLFSKNLDFVISKLKEDPITRQATLHVANQEAAKLDHPPCLQLIHYTIKDGKLNTDVVFRSNDGVKAVAMNVFALLELSRYIAKKVGINELGSYSHHALSFHAYSRDWKALEGYCKMFDERDCIIDYEDYLEAYADYADDCREKSKQLQIKQESKLK
ncbi:thymidylate synthase [Acetobacterium woodii]|uniref:Thymidylate synthase ThyA n=1 Tax=Acetobacterium woodii (strain ATCC 29683 / DSM 1030 / JCM 2381 / KCTC 1655 / WB1) TaxID=931626 RepID=H6LGP9_ACEWD|nr:thymidylate synthase [Acetobacterium woodii]AFA48377.1 thymidylate synthase ThyA [Acetobacterium woodii DSM 1030]